MEILFITCNEDKANMFNNYYTVKTENSSSVKGCNTILSTF